ncbi:unnamed protein product [Closterium sp. NIES-65]|nr:unnamed protein product [Closterium sp. NIES-65]
MHAFSLFHSYPKNAPLTWLCALFERRLKEMNPGVKNITYDISELYQFMESLPDLTALVLDESICAYNVHFGGVASPDAGINPQFYNWNVVLVKYCDGSSFTGGSGKKNKTEETGKTLYYRGHWNLNGVLQDLLDTQNLNHGEEVLVGGCSAGAVAVSIKCDQIATWLEDYGIKTKCFMDGGFFPDVVDVNGERSLREKVQRLATLHDIDRIGINGDCKDGEFRKFTMAWMIVCYGGECSIFPPLPHTLTVNVTDFSLSLFFSP